jgi:MoaA/NifB/PqqE/SkfB family radical SAM enzyme
MSRMFLRSVRRWVRAQVPVPGVAYLVTFLNTKCEQDCAHCFVREERDDQLLTPDELAAVGRRLPGLLQLTLTGGEPTLRRDFSAAAAAIINASGVPFVSIHSNGFATERIEAQMLDLMARAPRAQISVRISLDGFGELHDRIRRRAGSWARAAETIARLQGIRRRYHRFRLFTDTVLSQYNYGRLASLLDYLRALEGEIDGRELLLLRGDPRDPKSGGVSAEQYRAMLSQFSPELSGIGRGDVGWSLPEHARRAVYRQILAVAEGRGNAAGCVAGWRFAVLGATGDVSACELTAGGGALGNVRVDGPDVQAILARPRAAAVRRDIRAGVCAEGCSYECAALATIALRGSRLLKAVADTSAPSGRVSA